ncbi:DUF3105 domain-containing protein [Nocardioides sp. C4-1]|uniref:DUF3105 domain-containing protein n=1 Tax=Nocardioides sp. C4-1 TaxID=3151851 RepID=UPI0032651617
MPPAEDGRSGEPGYRRVVHPGSAPLPPPPPLRRRRVSAVLAVLAAVVVVAAASIVPRLFADDDTERGAGTGTGPAVPFDSDPATPDEPSASETVDTSDLSAVRIWNRIPSSHVEGPITYRQSPPIGGDHWTSWMDCGVYDEPVPNEMAVHDLEHGAVWFTYDPARINAYQAGKLAAKLPQNGIMSPYVGLRSPVVLTAWGRQLDLAGVNDPRIELFVDEYQRGVTAPEPMFSCAGGLDLDEAEDLARANNASS